MWTEAYQQIFSLGLARISLFLLLPANEYLARWVQAILQHRVPQIGQGDINIMHVYFETIKPKVPRLHKYYRNPTASSHLKPDSRDYGQSFAHNAHRVLGIRQQDAQGVISDDMKTRQLQCIKMNCNATKSGEICGLLHTALCRGIRTVQRCDERVTSVFLSLSLFFLETVDCECRSYVLSETLDLDGV